jgi:hypothetical protein
MLLRLAAFWYRVTGHYCFYAKIKQDEFIATHIVRFYSEYEDKDYDFNFQNFIDIHIGLWQARHGFYRSMRR